MRHIFLLSIAAVLFFSLTANAQTSNRKILEELLDTPAPPAIGVIMEAAEKEYPPEFYSKSNVPPDDAPIAELLAYWAAQNASTADLNYSIKPSAIVAQRILQACEENPEIITSYLNVLPNDDLLINTVKRFYDDESLKEKYEPYWRKQLENWLKFNSSYFSSALIKKARAVKDENEYVTNQTELLALAKVDWEAARPIIERLDGDQSQPVASTLAKWALYRHAIAVGDESDAEKYREQLKAVVEDRSAAPGKRDLAMDALTQSREWDGRDDWYLSLLGDETLFDLRVNGRSYTGLTTLVRRSPPDKWIPAMVKLAASPNRNVRRAAVRNLAEFLDGNRRDVVEALLPWLSNPKWADEVNNERSRLLQALVEVDVPESVPGLIQIVMTEGKRTRSMAAQALAKYKSPQAIPALSYALANEKSEAFRTALIEALIAAGGISDDRQMSALESYAALQSIANDAEVASSEGESMMRGANVMSSVYDEEDEERNPVPIEVSIGRFLSEQTEPTDGLARLAFVRVKILRRTNPKIATALAEMMQKWRGRVVSAELLRRVGENEADAETILNLLAKRKEIRELTPNELLYMRGQNAVARGVGAVVSEDANEMLNILRQTDADAKIALLAAARLVRTSLPVREISELLKNTNKTLALAAERYLEAEDSVAARRAVLAAHPGDALILGARYAFVPNDRKTFNNELLSLLFESVNSVYFGAENFPKIEKSEDKLRAEMRANTDLQSIFAILPEAEAGQQVVRVYKNKIVYTFYENAARYWERTLTPKEYEAFYRFLIEKEIDGISSPAGQCYDCGSNEFVMFGRDGGRRVLYNSYGENPPFNDLEKFFNQFRQSKLVLHYRLSNKLKNLEVLLADDQKPVRAIWKNDADFRVLIEDKAKQAEIFADLQKQEKSAITGIDDEDYAARQRAYEELGRRRAELQSAHYSWRKIENGVIGATVSSPAGYSLEQLNRKTSEESPYQGATAYSAGGKTAIYAGFYEQRGLWKAISSQEPVLIAEGWFLKPIISGDEQWVVAAKADETGVEPMSVVRINLQTKKQYKVVLPTAAKFYPVAAVPASNKILLYRARDEESGKNPDQSSPPPAEEYYLLDPNTGAAQIAKGEFRPIRQQNFRPLQPTGNPSEFWAAIYDDKNKTTEIGRYDLKNFKFTLLLQIPEIRLESRDVWFDEKDAKIYFIFQGHLLALPLNFAKSGAASD